MSPMLNEKEKIEIIRRISLDLNQTNDIDLLLEKILTNARHILRADAASIYLREGDALKFRYTQNETLQKRIPPGTKLIYQTFSVPLTTRSIAGYVATKGELVNVDDVRQLAASCPYSFNKRFDEIASYQTRSILTVPMTNQREDVLGVMQFINAQDDLGRVIPFSRTDEVIIKHFASSAALTIERAQLTRSIILRMSSMASLRDPMETGAHVNRVAAYSVEIYEEWARTHSENPVKAESKKDVLRLAAMLHDVGKVAISDLILKKPGPLTPEEFEDMKRHTYIGARLFKNVQSDFEEMAATLALNHHERWDGTGYPGHIDPVTGEPLPGLALPDGRPRPKRGEEIPFFGRIVAVADVYDALSSQRCYKQAWDKGRVLDVMHRSSGKHFDPEILRAFFSCLEMLKSISRRYPDEDTPVACID